MLLYQIDNIIANKNITFYSYLSTFHASDTGIILLIILF